MPIQLTPKNEALIREKVESGLYDNAEAAMDTALQLLDAHDRKLQRLREAIAEGEKGVAVPWTPELMEQILRNADERQRRGEKPNPDVCP